MTFEGGVVSWRRPNETTLNVAQDSFIDALNDYWLISTNLRPPFNAIPTAGGSPAFAAALAGWTDKPALPEILPITYRSASPAAALKVGPEGT